MSFFIDRPAAGTRALLVVVHPRWLEDSEHPDEFRELARAANAEIVGELELNLSKPDAGMYFSKGKLEEVVAAAERCEAEVVLVSEDLSPAQERNIEKRLQRRLVGRTELIIDIFAQRARTHEGKLQVELAQMRHMTTRLVRGWTHLDRQSGGIGGRGGVGETQLELDQRMVADRIRHTEAQLDRVRQRRALGRRHRQRQATPTVALIGYTNAGKSTLFNRLSSASVLAQDMLFATLDPTMRGVSFPGAGEAVLADTVGFVRRLPHKLVDAFKATLEEVAAADLLLHVIDVSSPRCREQVENVQQVLEEIHADEIPRIDVLNKTDLLGDGEADLPPAKGERTRVAVSALTGAGMDALCSAVGHALAGELQRGIMVLRPDQGRARAWIYANGSVAEERADAEGCLHISVALSQAQIDSAQRQHGLVFRAFRQ
jgi:GTP-binding protein HflX